jgi:CheY-like chemotaxis protein
MYVNAVGRPMEILLIEDSLTSARMTIGALRNGHAQHRLTWLTDGDEALEFLYQRGKYVRVPHPDLILLDLTLPGKDGREVLAEVKSNDTLRSIPLVIMTASTDPEDVERSESLQVEGYVTKPVDLDKFLSLVKQLREYWHADMIVPATP